MLLSKSAETQLLAYLRYAATGLSYYQVGDSLSMPNGTSSAFFKSRRGEFGVSNGPAAFVATISDETVKHNQVKTLTRVPFPEVSSRGAWRTGASMTGSSALETDFGRPRERGIDI